MSAGHSSVGQKTIYEDGDQRNVPQSEIEHAERYNEGKENSHKPNDSKDQRSIANRLANEEKKLEAEEKNQEFDEAKKDPTLPARNHGNEPSKGAKIDKEIQDEEEEYLKRKGKA
ncbi:hypothetical protein MMC30_007819 [Trapelia coarctata]|nr:hypothetical protein [Trapelia coarctata]